MLVTKIVESSPNVFRKDVIFNDEQIKGKKALKTEIIKSSFVTYNDKEFDADEDSLNRMSRYIVLAQANYTKLVSEGELPADAYQQCFGSTISWKLKDNTIHDVTIEQLVEVFNMSVTNMANIWLNQQVS